MNDSNLQNLTDKEFVHHIDMLLVRGELSLMNLRQIHDLLRNVVDRFGQGNPNELKLLDRVRELETQVSDCEYENIELETQVFDCEDENIELRERLEQE